LILNNFPLLESKRYHPSSIHLLPPALTAPFLLHQGKKLSDCSESEFWSGGIEYTVVGIEEDVAVDILSSATDRLQSSEAGCTGSVGCTEVEDVRGNGGICGCSDADREGWESGGAREGVAALCAVVRSSGDLCVVGINWRISGEKESSSGVSDSSQPRHGVSCRTDLVAGGRELPEAVGVVNTGIGDAAGVSC